MKTAARVIMKLRSVLTYAAWAGVCAPMLAVMVFATWSEGRSAKQLEIADRCVDLAHQSEHPLAAAGPAMIEQCRLYFEVRSESNSDEDERRWKTRNNERAKSSACA